MKVSVPFQVFPSSGVPIYRQLIDQVQALVASGRLSPETFLPSVRQVAEELQINPMTVSKAYSLMERDGILELVRGQGMRIKKPEAKSNLRERQATLLPLLKQVVATAYQLSMTPEQVEEMMKPLLKDLKNERDHS